MTTTVLPLVDDLASCCSPFAGDVMAEGDADRLARVFKALGDPTRLRLLSIVASGDNGEACVCELPEPLGLSQPTVSHHLKLLVDAGVLEREQRGKWAFYRLVPGAMSAVAAVLCR